MSTSTEADVVDQTGKDRPKADMVDELEKPMWITDLMWARPCTFMWSVWALSTVLVVIQFTTQEIMINDIGNFYARDEPYAVEQDAVWGLETRPASSAAETTTPQQSVAWNGMAFLYEPADGEFDILTEANMLKVDAYEKIVTDHPKYPDFCFKVDGTCSNFLSITRMPLPGQHRDENDVLVFDDFAAWRQAIVDDLMSDEPNLKDLFPEAFPRDSNVAGSVIARFSMGRPLAGFTSPMQREECDTTKLEEGELCPVKLNADGMSQWGLQRNWAISLSEPFLAYNKTMSKEGGPEFFHIGSGITDYEVESLVNADIMKLIGSIGAVGILLWFHTASIFLTVSSLFHIMWAFPVSWFFYDVVFGFDVMTQMNLMTLFVVLAVGADDVYVVYNQWLQAPVERPHLATNPRSRAAFTLRRATGAMLVTSLTTSVAFFASFASVMPTIKVLGALAGTTVLINFLFVISWFPCCIFWWHQMGYDRRWCWQRRVSDAGVAGDAPAHDVEAGDVEIAEAKKPGMQRQSSNDVLDALFHADGLRPTERFYHDKLYPFLQRFALPVSLASLVCFGVAIFLATGIRPQSKTDGDFFDDKVPMQYMQNVMSREYDNADGSPRASLYWGVLGIQRAGFDINDQDNTGFTLLDSTFSPTKALIEKMVTVCAEGRDPKWHDVIREGQVLCWPEQLKRYVEYQMDGGQTGAWDALADADLSAAIDSFVSNSSAPYGGLQRNVTANSFFPYDFGWDENNEVVWWRLSFNTTLQWGDTVPEMRTHLDRWEEFEDRADVLLGEQSPEFFQIVSDFWVFVESSQSLVDSAVFGVVLALSVGTAVLFMSTHNIVITLLAMLTVVCNVCNLIALLPVMGWEIGVTESISLQLVVGLSIDYVAHLAVAYQEAPVDETGLSAKVVRQLRTQFSMVHIGVSVLGGAMTSAGSTVFMMFATMVFMFRFGQILIAACVFSFFYAHFLFLPLCLLVGPAHDCGSVTALCRRIKNGGAEGQSAPTPIAAAKPPQAPPIVA